ncbi:hypothetical protein VOLCADRAFT_105405 [Volvox carteri f. nagariensis]|uniref:Uncharacterized protein n=1 Tax=Volvox carteri f. nagariensis TaxID=3068 RepID=D8U0M1_VOLCA|nr:uncharacterized protein VOLCADRAFT_105405 [Volvox carteri f. nagariensis]EFJ46743.1 hypothetical protein VOLCADRAFT_105405 [Volvox carteri f. nagariensis]|eukprot:XP_002952272.1 hypothetical protein VOLCADRAFT_105405 [Volvox carteri f. nagariensis]
MRSASSMCRTWTGNAACGTTPGRQTSTTQHPHRESSTSHAASLARHSPLNFHRPTRLACANRDGAMASPTAWRALRRMASGVSSPPPSPTAMLIWACAWWDVSTTRICAPTHCGTRMEQTFSVWPARSPTSTLHRCRTTTTSKAPQDQASGRTSCARWPMWDPCTWMLGGPTQEQMQRSNCFPARLAAAYITADSIKASLYICKYM